MQHAGVEMVAEHGIHTLLTLDAAEAGKSIADDHRLEVATIASDGKVFAFKAGTDPTFDLLRG
jgi:hypothetical protein